MLEVLDTTTGLYVPNNNFFILFYYIIFECIPCFISVSVEIRVCFLKF